MSIAGRIKSGAARAMDHARQVKRLSMPYFNSDEKWMARGMLAGAIGLSLASVYMMVLLNEWNQVFYDALQHRDEAVFWRQIGIFTAIAFGAIIIGVYRFVLTQKLGIRWRAWMTRDMLARWSSNRAAYLMELGSHAGSPDNPDQRIQEDAASFASSTVSISLGLLSSVVTLCSFAGILWAKSGALPIHFMGASYSIPGFMLWAALCYAIAGSLIGHQIGKSLTSLNGAQQRLEANFRHHLMRNREYAEAIALEGGASMERQALEGRFSKAMSNSLDLLRVQKLYTWFNSGYSQLAVIFPFLVSAPRFFSGGIELGGLMQISSAFGRVQDALSWLVDNYPRLSEWSATTTRLTQFFSTLEAIEARAANRQATDGSLEARASGLDISLPNGEPLLAGADFAAKRGDLTLIKGPSGSGKSTFFRSLSGIWPHVGERSAIEIPERSLFLAQRPYFPEGPLREALRYPNPLAAHSDEELRLALAHAKLAELGQSLDEDCNWSQRLSGGEQQRLAIARAFLAKPLWIFADEPTSGLDAETESDMLRALSDLTLSQGGGLVLIAHRWPAGFKFDAAWEMVARPPGSPAPWKLEKQQLASSA